MAGLVFTGTVYGGVVAEMATKYNGIFLHTNTPIITCHISLRLANVIGS
jgi:hypothetical protein